MKKFSKIFGVIGCMVILSIAGIFGVNSYVKSFTKDKIIRNSDYSRLNDIDCIVVLGAGLFGDRPSPMLEDRLNRAIELYKSGVSKKIIMTGDHGRKDYDEVNAMKNFAIRKGVPSEDIFMDHAGFSSYDSMYRAKEIFLAKRIVVVTQDYHLYRSLYIADRLGICAYGVPAKHVDYAGNMNREVREIIARDKDFVKCIFKPKPQFLGDKIPVSGNGNITNG